MKNILVLTEAMATGEWIATERLIHETHKFHPDYNFYLIALSENKIINTDFKFIKILKYSRSKKPFSFIKRTYKDFLNISSAIKEINTKYNFDATISTYYLASLSALFSRSIRGSLFYYFHGIRSNPAKNIFEINYADLIIKLLERLALVQSNLILVPSLFSKIYVQNMLKPFGKNKNITILPNLVTADFNDKSIFNKGNLFEKLSIDENSKIILYCGRMVKFKGIENLILAFNLLLKKRKDIALIIASPSFNKDLLLFKEISKTIKGNKFIKIVFDPDKISIVNLYKSAHLFVLASESEQAPLSVLEAIHCQTPVLATSVGNVPELLKSIDPGLILKDNKPLTILGGLEYVFSLGKNETGKIKHQEKIIAEKHNVKNSVRKFIDAMKYSS